MPVYNNYINHCIPFLQEMKDECKVLRGIKEKSSSLQSHMISLQQELETYKTLLAEKQQRNEQLQNKIAKVCVILKYLIMKCFVFRLRGVVGMLLHKRKWNLLVPLRQIKRH